MAKNSKRPSVGGIQFMTVEEAMASKGSPDPFAAQDAFQQKRLCCCIPDQTKSNEGCKNLAEYQIWMGDNPTPDDYTESCAEHLEEMLDDSVRFEVLRIPQAA